MFDRRFRSFSLALLLLVVAGTASAQTPQAILERYSKAVDPDGKIATVAGFRSSGTFEMPAAGISATFTALQRRPNQMTMSIVIGGMGELRQGFDGTTAWASDPMQGPRLMTGLEAAAMVDGADFRAMARPADLFSAMELAGEADLDGEKCMRVKLTWKSSRVSTECFSVATGLIIESRGTQSSPQGEVETIARMYDYKPIGGILMPHRTVNSMMGTQQVLTITEVVVGEQDAKAFELPPEIKALKKP